jgi:hypothetical protein
MRRDDGASRLSPQIWRLDVHDLRIRRKERAMCVHRGCVSRPSRQHLLVLVLVVLLAELALLQHAGASVPAAAAALMGLARAARRFHPSRTLEQPGA